PKSFRASEPGHVPAATFSRHERRPSVPPTFLRKIVGCKRHATPPVPRARPRISSLCGFSRQITPAPAAETVLVVGGSTGNTRVARQGVVCRRQVPERLPRNARAVRSRTMAPRRGGGVGLR